MAMTNKTYDKLRYLSQIVLPAVATLYFALSQIWGLPHGEEIVGTITAIVAFMGTSLKISSHQYYKKSDEYQGIMNVSDSETKTAFSLVLYGDPYDLVDRKDVKFKVVREGDE